MRSYGTVVISFLVGASMVLSAAPAGAVTILQQTFTAQDLFDNATFPTRTPILNTGPPKTLEFGVGSAISEKLVQINLLAPGTLNIQNPATITLVMRGHVELTTDNDFIMGVTDGTDIVGMVHADAVNGGHFFLDASDAGSTLSPSFAATAATAVFPSTWQIDLTLDTTTNVTGTFGAFTDSAVSPRVLNRSAAVDLLVIGNDAAEQYRFEEIEVTILQVPALIPEPSSLVLLSLGLAGIALCRRREPH